VFRSNCRKSCALLPSRPTNPPFPAHPIAEQLGADVSVVRAAVESLAQLFVKAARLNLNDQDFQDTLLVLGFPPEVSEELVELFGDSKQELRAFEEGLQVDLPHLKNMEWRLEVQLASRSLTGQLNPVYVTRWDTEVDGEVESQFLQLSYTNLKHVAEELEAAVKEMRSGHVRRVTRNVK
jgi:COMM domain containing 2